MSPVDLVLVEGYKRDPFPKLEVHRAANGKPLIHPEDPHVMAIASDIALPAAKVPVVGLDDIEAIADLLLKHAVPVYEISRATSHAQSELSRSSPRKREPSVTLQDYAIVVLDSRWSLCSGQPKAGPEYGNEWSVRRRNRQRL